MLRYLLCALLFLYAAQHDYLSCDAKQQVGELLNRAMNMRETSRLYPGTDIVESSTHYKITAEIPGLDLADLKLEFVNRVLIIAGEKKQTNTVKDEKTHQQECRYGPFNREFLLPEDAEIENVKDVKTSFYRHVLTIKIPRKPAERKVLTIQAK